MKLINNNILAEFIEIYNEIGDYLYYKNVYDKIDENIDRQLLFQIPIDNINSTI